MGLLTAILWVKLHIIMKTYLFSKKENLTLSKFSLIDDVNLANHF
jgi:hypothetical protein